MLKKLVVCCAALIATAAGPVMLETAFAAQKGAKKKASPPAKRETLACRLGTEDRHARIAVVLVGGRTTEFAYYSKWKPRTCSIYLQRNDAFSRWSENGSLTKINLEQGGFVIEHRKGGEFHFVFRDVDRERYCGMDGRINGTLTIRRGSSRCELTGIMEEGIALGEAHRQEPAPVAESAPEVQPASPATPALAAPAPVAPAVALPATEGGERTEEGAGADVRAPESPHLPTDAEGAKPEERDRVSGDGAHPG
jgi:hypothetical protein